MAFCKECGQQLPEGANYCPNCGTPNNDYHKDASAQRETVYEGSVHKCPNCGEVLPSFMRNCPACGFEIRGANINSTVREFAQKLESIDSEQEEEIRIGLFRKRIIHKQISRDKATERKISVIQNFPIPNTTEDMLEFMILASSNLNVSIYKSAESDSEVERLLADAWLSKVKQVYKKATVSCGNEKDIQRITELYNSCLTEVKVQKRKGKRKSAIENTLIFGFLPIMFAIIAIVSIAKNKSYDMRLTSLSKEIEASITQGNYLDAAKKLNYLYYPGDSSALVNKWEAARNAYIGNIEDAVGEKGLLISAPVNSAQAEGKKQADIEKLFRDAGFVNVISQGAEDLLSDELRKDNQIVEITLDGIEDYSKEISYPFTSIVMIIYHSGKMVSVPASDDSLEGHYYEDVKYQLMSAGFTNIETENLNNLDALFSSKNGQVKEISIDGETDFSKGDVFIADAKIILRYNSFKEP